MIKHFLPIIFFLLTHIAIGQHSKSQLEVLPFIRYDYYPEFSYNYKDRVCTDYLQIQGISRGTKFNYKYLLGSDFRIKAGLGYYRYTFNSLKGKNKWGETSARHIAYPTPDEALYSTDGY